MLDDLQTGKVIRSAISSKAFAVLSLWKFRAETPPPPCVWNSKLRYPPPFPPPIPLEFQSKKPPSPSEFQDAARGMV